MLSDGEGSDYPVAPGQGRLQRGPLSSSFQQAESSDDANENGGPHDGVAQERCCNGCKSEFFALFTLQRWKYPTAREAVAISIVSIIVTVLISISGIVLGVVGESASTLAFAFDGVVDIVTSIIILWRFSETAPGLQGRSRENRASVGIAMSFFGLAAIVAIAAVGHLVTHERVGDQGWLLALTIPSFFCLLFLGVLKLHIAKVLHSMALFEDGVSSFGGAVLSLFVIIGVAALRKNETLWWLDSACALFISLLYILFGIYVLRQHPAWRTREFWQGASETDEVGGEEDGDIGTASSQRFDVGIDLQPIDMDTI